MALTKRKTIKLSFLLFKLLHIRGLHRRRRICQRLRFQRAAPAQKLQSIKELFLNQTREKMMHFQGLASCFQMQSLNHNSTESSWWENAKNTYAMPQWLKYFRMSKELFTVLLNCLTPYLTAAKNNVIKPEKQLAMCIISLASGKSNEQVSKLFAVSQTDVTVSVENVCRGIVKVLLSQHLRAPKLHELRSNIKEFESAFNFPQCGGILGSIHIPVHVSKLNENAADYMNNNGDYSVILQGVIDASGRFWDVSVGWPGNMPQSKVLTQSTLWSKAQEGKLFPETAIKIGNTDVPVYVLADPSYPLSQWVLKPYFHTEYIPHDQKQFNKKFETAYKMCKTAFERLTGRWNCLVSNNDYSLEILPLVIMACCVLHNMCEIEKESVLSSWVNYSSKLYQQPPPFPCYSIMGHRAEKVRHAVKDSFSNSQNSPSENHILSVGT